MISVKKIKKIAKTTKIMRIKFDRKNSRKMQLKN
jgi:hypothetical protein